MTMKKTLVALAALAATASFAQVTLSGRIALAVSTYSANGATAGAASDAASRTMVADNSSRLKFAVNEDLGGGLRAFGVYEFGLNFDTGAGTNQAGGANSATAFNGSRESHIGIGNNDIELRLGRQNVFWTQGDLHDASANFVGKDAIGDAYTRLANVRQNNAILLNLNSSSFAGSQLYWAPEVANESAPVSSPTAAQSSANATTWGGKLNWDNGAWRFMADYQKRNNIATDAAGTFPAANTTADLTSAKLGLGYRYAEGSMVAAHYWDQRKDFTDAATNNTATTQAVAGVTGGSMAGGNKQTGWGVTVKHNLGAGWTGYGSYGVLNNMSATGTGGDLNDSGSTLISLAVRKDLSKRTGIYASYGQVKNAAAGTMGMPGGGFVPVTGPNAAAGSSPTFLLVGMMHNF